MYYYTADNAEITFTGIEYNLFLGIDRALAAEIHQSKLLLDAQKSPYDTTIASPFIEYIIAVSKAGSDELLMGGAEHYAVDITESIL